jgi:pSer/pThr/pTyr-binding forkhead associated (FHA) protein
MARLVLNCEGDVLTHELVGELVTIGRAKLNDIVIDDATVSAQHAMVLRAGDSYWLKDLNSTNGTQINDAVVADAVLRDGDRIRFGSVTVVFAEPCRKGWSSRGIRKFWPDDS